MIRQIIHIDEEKCNGCGLCVSACHEGAIGLVNGKARLLRDDYCDGMGDCLPECPTGAITFEEREAAAYDEAAVVAAKMMRAKAESHANMPAGFSCPSSAVQQFDRASAPAANASALAEAESAPSQLAQWPCQIKLVPPTAPFFQGADLLVAADCTAFAYASFHRDFMAGHITLVGCPKLDGVDYAEKLTAILTGNDIRSITVARMSVPCCGGLEAAVRRAADASGRGLAVRVVTIGTNGELLSDEG